MTSHLLQRRKSPTMLRSKREKLRTFSTAPITQRHDSTWIYWKRSMRYCMAMIIFRKPMLMYASTSPSDLTTTLNSLKASLLKLKMEKKTQGSRLSLNRPRKGLLRSINISNILKEWKSKLLTSSNKSWGPKPITLLTSTKDTEEPLKYFQMRLIPNWSQNCWSLLAHCCPKNCKISSFFLMNLNFPKWKKEWMNVKY